MHNSLNEIKEKGSNFLHHHTYKKIKSYIALEVYLERIFFLKIYCWTTRKIHIFSECAHLK